MAFTEDQKREFISELQHYLYVISYHNKKIPHIIADGIYGKETAEAVKIFQREHDIRPTGETDSTTWNEIVSVYKGYMKPLSLNVFYEGLVLTPDSREEIIYIIQILLHKLHKEYHNVPDVDINGVYSEQMKECVECFAKMCGRNGKKEFDADMWNILAGEYNGETFRNG